MAKSKYLWIVLVLLIIIAGWGVYVWTPKSAFNGWLTITHNQATVEIAKITDGKAFWDGRLLQYNVNDQPTAFGFDAVYKGIPFVGSIAVANKVQMSVLPDLHPNDGVLEGFAVEKIGSDLTKPFEIWIFVDSDWKKQFPNAQIWWGKSYEHKKPFSWTEVSSGIFAEKVLDDQRFSPDLTIATGGLLVGDLHDSVIDSYKDGTFFGIH